VLRPRASGRPRPARSDASPPEDARDRLLLKQSLVHGVIFLFRRDTLSYEAAVANCSAHDGRATPASEGT